MLLSGMIVGVNWVFLFLSYAHTSVAVATLAYYFAPVLVMLRSTLLFREKMTALQVGCFAAATVGLALVIGGGGLRQGNLLGVVCGLAAACFYAAAVIVNKSMRRGTGFDRTLGSSRARPCWGRCCCVADSACSAATRPSRCSWGITTVPPSCTATRRRAAPTRGRCWNAGSFLIGLCARRCGCLCCSIAYTVSAWRFSFRRRG